MSPARLVLLVSVATNLVLAAALALRTGAGASGQTASTLVATPEATPPASPAAEPVTWTHLQRLDEAGLVAALRRQGWSREVLAAIVRAKLDLEYEPRLEALDASHRPPYWRGNRYGSLHSTWTAAARAEGRQIRRELNLRMRTLLGEDAEDPLATAYRQQRYGPVAPEKIDALEAIESDYRDLIAEVRERAGNQMTDEDLEVIRLLEQERAADLSALLTPEEKDAYDLRASRTAMTLRYRLQHFDPTEEEYVAIFRLRKAFDDRHGGVSLMPQQQPQRAADEAELNRQVAAVLGEARFREYELKTHPTWNQAAAWVRLQQLPETTTEPLARLGREMQDRLLTLNRDQSLSSAERAARRNALYQEARRQLGQILPADYHARYESGPGRWLRSLQPPTP